MSINHFNQLYGSCDESCFSNVFFFFFSRLIETNNEVKKGDDTSDNEFHDAEDAENQPLEEKFSDALDLTETNEPELSEEELLANTTKSECLKQEGNTFFKNADYEKAIEKYTEAIDICPKINKNDRSILYGNRAAAHKHIGNQQIAIDDCTQAIELNSNYVKAYAR